MTTVTYFYGTTVASRSYQSPSYDKSVMTTQWISAVIQVLKNICKIEDEIRRLETVILERKSHRISVGHETNHLELYQSGLVLYRENLRNLLTAAKSAADWQVTDPDDVA